MGLHESFLSHGSNRWFKIAVLISAGCIAAYVWHDPIDGPNGGTWLGYSLGTLGVLIIICLALLGARKRSYSSQLGTVKAWASAHVWLGLSLSIVATLHCGFQFGWNIHTFAWVLMISVILSGVWGVAAYLRYPDQITSAKGPMLAEDMLKEISDLDQQMLDISAGLGQESQARTLSSINRTKIGGGFWQQVFGVRKRAAWSDQFAERLREELEKSSLRLAPSMKPQTLEQTIPGASETNATLMFMANDFVSADQDQQQREKRRTLLDLLSRKKALVTKLNEDITRRARMSLWLYFHVPLTMALLAALIVHVLSVFMYW